MKKNSGARFCVPRVKTNLSRTTAGDRNISVTPMTLLDRFREAVLRIIMISAPSNPTPRRSKPTRVNSQKYYNSTDTYHNEAVVSSLSGPTRATMLKTAAKYVTHLVIFNLLNVAFCFIVWVLGRCINHFVGGWNKKRCRVSNVLLRT